MSYIFLPSKINIKVLTSTISADTRMLLQTVECLTVVRAHLIVNSITARNRECIKNPSDGTYENE